MSELPEVVWVCAGDAAESAGVPPWWIVREAKAGRLPSKPKGMGRVAYPLGSVVEKVNAIRAAGHDLPHPDAPNPHPVGGKDEAVLRCCATCGRDTVAQCGICARCTGDYRDRPVRPKRIRSTEEWSR